MAHDAFKHSRPCDRNIAADTNVSDAFRAFPIARQMPAHRAHRIAVEHIHVSNEDARLRYHRAADRVQSAAAGSADANLSARAKRRARAADQRAQGEIRSFRR